MKVAYIITGLGLGGAEVVTITIANEIARRGHEVMFIYLTGDNAHAEKFDPAIQIVGIGMKKTPIGLLKALFSARKILKQFNPDVLHANMIHANLFARMLRVIMHTPRTICSEHTKNIEGNMRMKAYRYTNPLSDYNTNVSQEAVDFFIEQRAFKPSNSGVMYNGIPFAKYNRDVEAGKKIRAQYGIGEDEFLFINLGRLTQAKNHANLLRAFAMLGSHTRLMILGQGDLHDHLDTIIDTLNLRGRAILAGAHPNVGDFYSAADCFALSSTWEGLPMVILEAMSYELPIVTTNVGGAAETIGDPRWIVPAEDSSALAAKMAEMQSLTAQERKTIAEDNRRKASLFDINLICDQWEKLYRNQ